MKTESIVTAFLKNNGRFLLIKRAGNRRFYPGVWSGIGGHAEDDEMPESERACLREIREESGIEDVFNLRLRYLCAAPRNGYIVMHYIYFGETNETALTQTDEGELYWIHEKDVLGKGFTPVMRRIMEHYFSHAVNNNNIYLFNELDMSVMTFKEGRETLKEKLACLRNNGFKATGGEDIFSLALRMTEQIGDPDPELRDSLIYQAFCQFFSCGELTPGQMRDILFICLDWRRIFCGIGEKGTDTVFTRAFSVLIVPLALSADRCEPFLTDVEFTEVKDSVIKYAHMERDFRGYEDGKGWAHAAAHAADALEELARSPRISRIALIEVLEAVKVLASQGETEYTHDEDERLAVAAAAVFERDMLSEKDVSHWLKGFADLEKEEQSPHDIYRRLNIANFIRSFNNKLRPWGSAPNPAREQAPLTL